MDVNSPAFQPDNSRYPKKSNKHYYNNNTNYNNNKYSQKNQRYQQAPNNFTHFLSFPLVTPELTTLTEKFHTKLMTEYKNTAGLDPTILVPASHFHLTICMLTLPTLEEEKKAEKLLSELTPQVIAELQERPLDLNLKPGFSTLKKNGNNAHVLYVPIEEKQGGLDRMNKIGNLLKEAFVKAGLAPQSVLKEDILFHMTILNTRYRKPRKPERIPLDISQISRAFADFEWGDVRVSDVHVSCRFKFHPKTGFYQDIARLELKVDDKQENQNDEK